MNLYSIHLLFSFILDKLLRPETHDQYVADFEKVFFAREKIINDAGARIREARPVLRQLSLGGDRGDLRFDGMYASHGDRKWTGTRKELVRCRLLSSQQMRCNHGERRS